MRISHIMINSRYVEVHNYAHGVTAYAQADGRFTVYAGSRQAKGVTVEVDELADYVAATIATIDAR